MVIGIFKEVVTELSVEEFVDDAVVEIVAGIDAGVIVRISVEPLNGDIEMEVGIIVKLGKMVDDTEVGIVFGSIFEIVDGMEIGTDIKLAVEIVVGLLDELLVETVDGKISELVDESVVVKIAEFVVELLINVINGELTLSLTGKYISK